MDKEEYTSYFIVFNNSNFLERKTLDNTEYLDGIFMIVKRSYFTTHTTSWGFTYDYYKFNIVDRNGNPTILDCSWFTIEDLGEERRIQSYHSRVSTKIFDKNSNELRIVKFETNAGATGIFKKFSDYFQNLKSVGSWYGLELQQKNIALTKKVEELEKCIERLEESHP